MMMMMMIMIIIIIISCLLLNITTSVNSQHTNAKLLYSQLTRSIALQFSQCVVTFLIAVVVSSISKPELFDWKMWFVSEKTAVFTPNFVILITVTTTTGVSTWVVHPACALSTARWCPTPVRHLSWITWHPPRVWIWTEKPQIRTITLIFDKLLAVWGDCGETRQLRQTHSCIVNVACVTTCLFVPIHQCSVFAVVTDDCHANSILVIHVTGDAKRRQASFTTWVNDVIPTLCCRVERLKITTGLCKRCEENLQLPNYFTFICMTHRREGWNSHWLLLDWAANSHSKGGVTSSRKRESSNGLQTMTVSSWITS